MVQDVAWRERLATQHIKSLFSKEVIASVQDEQNKFVVLFIKIFLVDSKLIPMQVIDVIIASTNDMGPYSLDSFRKSNLSASWRVVGVDSSVVTDSEVVMCSFCFCLTFLLSSNGCPFKYIYFCSS